MKILAIALLLATPLIGQTINPKQIRPGNASQVLTTSGGVTVWAAAPSGHSSTGASGAVQTADGSGSFLDSGCTAASATETCSGGFKSTGSTQGYMAFGVGTGSVPTTALPTHYAAWIGPASGTPDTFYAFPTTTPSAGQVMTFAAPTTVNGVTQAVGTWSSPAAGGSVTNFTAGTLSPIFTTSVATSSTTPALTFSLSTAAGHTFLGNTTGSTAAPAYVAIGTADLPTGIPNANLLNPSTTVHGATCTLGATCLSTLPLSCQPGLGDGLNAIPAGTYLTTTCRNETGTTWTLTAIRCVSDNSGTSTCNVTNGAGTALLTGAITGTPTYANGTQSGTTTISSGDYLKFTWIADGTSKQLGASVAGTY